MAINQNKKPMGNDLKEFTQLLLNNLGSLDSKVDTLQKDMSTLKSDVAVLKETKEVVQSLDKTLDKFSEKMAGLDKELAIKSSLWGVISSIITMGIAILIAYIVGIFKS